MTIASWGGSLRRRGGPASFRRLALVAATVFLAACASGDDNPTTGPVRTASTTITTTPLTDPPTGDDAILDVVVAVPDDVEMFFDYPRYLWHVRRLSVATTNAGETPIAIRSIAVRAPHFEPLDAEPKRTVIAPGQRIDVQVDFGELTTCTSSADDGPAAVLIELARGDEPPERYLAELDTAPIDEIRDRECAQQRVENAVSISFAPDPLIDGSTMRTAIEVVRNEGSPPIEVSSLRGSVIFSLVPVDDDEPVAVVEPGTDRLDIPIMVEVTRCDPHVVSQSSRTFDLAAYVSVDGAAAHRHQLDVDRDLQRQLQSMIDHCATTLEE